MSQFDPGPVIQIDVEDDAHRFPEIRVAFESLRGRKQDGFVVVLSEQTLHRFQHPGGKQLTTLEDAARFNQRLPKAEQPGNSSASALTIP
jgi:hypothetical protein